MQRSKDKKVKATVKTEGAGDGCGSSSSYVESRKANMFDFIRAIDTFG